MGLLGKFVDKGSGSIMSLIDLQLLAIHPFPLGLKAFYRWGGPGVLPEEEDFFLTPGDRGGEFFYSLSRGRPHLVSKQGGSFRSLRFTVPS